MAMNIATTLIVALATLFSGCGKEPAPAPTPNEDKTTIELRQTNATDNTVEVAVTLKNADIAYCLLLDAESQTPQLTAMTKGTKLTETATLTFDSLEAGYTYKVYGIAGRNSVYTNVVGIEVKTSGEIDYNFPEAGVKAITTTASKTMLFKDIEASDTSTLPNDAVEISIDNSTRYQTMEGFGPAITGSSAYNLSKMKPADREKIL
ncbi:MAG: hypothetical protein IKL43_05865, partial [Alistipes sp.]|nr:hypothetical protein [Alistipes sp.]